MPVTRSNFVVLGYYFSCDFFYKLAVISMARESVEMHCSNKLNIFTDQVTVIEILGFRL
jgi:CHASE1-domain containing sensor protein